jgi:multiple sugar transport system permease protein
MGGLYYCLVDKPVNGKFIGLANFAHLFSNAAFLNALHNTLKFTAICVPLNMTVPLLISLLLRHAVYGRTIFRRVCIAPLAVPVASVAFFWQIVFDMKGPLNHILDTLGMKPVDWLNTSFAHIAVIIIYLWKNAGCNIVLYMAGLSGIPPEYYEYAGINGANKVQRFLHITVVYLTPTFFSVFIMSIINSFKVFREVYLISGQYPHDSIYMLQHYMNNTFASLDYQKLTSAAYITAVLIMLPAWVFFSLERKISPGLAA